MSSPAINPTDGKGLRAVCQGASEVANRTGEDGIAVLLSLFYTLLVFGLVLTSISGPRIHESPADLVKVHQSELIHLTEAGLTQALHEIRKSKTLDRVEESHWSLSYSMGGVLWGSVDVTLDREHRLLHAKASVHERCDVNQALGAYPNKVLARARGQARLGRIRFRPPAKAPLVLARPDLLTLDADLTLLTRTGEATLAFVAQGEGAPELPQGALAIELPSARLDLPRLLGIRTESLAIMADRTVPVGEPLRMMQWGLTHLSGEHRFGTSNPLEGNGFLVVDGDLSLEGDVQHVFQGILLVLGSLTIRGRARVEGMTIVMGSLDVQRQGDDPGLTLQFDEEALRRSLWSVEGVRFSERTDIVMESVTEVEPGEAAR